MNPDILFKEESYKIIGACFNVFGHYPKVPVERIVAERGRYSQTA
jgi:hypothetical protein